MTLWNTETLEIITNSDYGFLANLVPIVLIIGISWYLSKKVRSALYIQFPITLAMKIIFQFLHPAIVFLSFALMVANIIGSKSDILADVKDIPKKARDEIMRTGDAVSKGLSRIELDRFNKRIEEKLQSFKGEKNG